MERAQSFEAQCQFVKNVMAKEEYREKPEEVGYILKNRIKKFYATNDFIQVDIEHFKPRLEPLYSAGVEPSNDTLVLFGIDFMGKQQLRQYFGSFNPQFVFIDESNCMITFPSAEAALMAIRFNVKIDSMTRFKVEDDPDNDLAELNLNFGDKAKNHPREWIELKPYIYRYVKSRFFSKEFERKLYIRYATFK
jgi:hypothetical protein